ncbi:Mu-like prophage protein gp29 [Actinobacillus equuli]|nr:Mu-like prophage protein gp29 [Actinobacillus equuli]
MAARRNSTALDDLDKERPHFVGEDFARKGDLTSLVIAAQQPNLVTEIQFIVELGNMPYAQQEQIVLYILKALPMLSGAAFDGGGNGLALAEKAQDAFGRDLVHSIQLTEKWYKENTAPFKAALEDGTLTKLPKMPMCLRTCVLLKLCVACHVFLINEYAVWTVAKTNAMAIQALHYCFYTLQQDKTLNPCRCLFSQISYKQTNDPRILTMSNKKQDLVNVIASRARAFDVWSYMHYLPNPDPVLRRMGRNISAYREMLSDSHVSGCVRRRKAAVKSLEWRITPTGNKQVDDVLNELFDRLPLANIINQMLDASLFGYQALEITWGNDGKYWLPETIDGKPQEWFVFDENNQLMLRTKENYFGEALPDKKFYS